MGMGNKKKHLSVKAAIVWEKENQEYNNLWVTYTKNLLLELNL